MIIGHFKQRTLLERILKKADAHHSFLFHGPEHIGKRTIAERFATHLVNDDNAILWETVERIDSDVRTIAPVMIQKKDKTITKDISVEDVRDVKKGLMLTADKKAKVLIVDDAHKLTAAAQNALLKTLEEPSKKTYIFLITHLPEYLLDTVHSRCFSLQFDLLDESEMRKKTDNEGYVEDALGRPGYLNRFHHDQEFRETVIYAREQLQGLFHKKMHERMALASDIAKKDDQFMTVFFTVWIYRIWRAAHETKKYHLLRVAERIEDTLHTMQKTNVNKHLILEDLLIHIV